MNTQFKFQDPSQSGWTRRDGTKVESFQYEVESKPGTALIFYVNPEHWAPIWLQKAGLWIKRYILRRSLET